MIRPDDRTAARKPGAHPFGVLLIVAESVQGLTVTAGRAAFLVAALVSFATDAQTRSYRIDPLHTYAEFEVGHLGVLRAQGRFENVTGSLRYEASAQAGAIDLAIPVSSVATGWDIRDQFLRGASMFDAVRYPRMRFVSTRFEFEQGRVVRVDGDLTLRDVTRQVTLVVLAMQCAQDACIAEAAGALRRREFAMDNWWPLIGDEVDLRLHVTAVRD